VKLKLNYDQQSVGQSVMVSSYHMEHITRFFFSVWQLRIPCCGLLTLTRGWVCNLLVQLLLRLARAVTLGSKSRRTQTLFYCLVWDSPNLEGQVSVCPSRTEWPSYTPGYWVPFSSPLTTRRTTVEVSNPPPHVFNRLRSFHSLLNIWHYTDCT
jgi:hypothetical protein